MSSYDQARNAEQQAALQMEFSNMTSALGELTKNSPGYMELWNVGHEYVEPAIPGSPRVSEQEGETAISSLKILRGLTQEQDQEKKIAMVDYTLASFLRERLSQWQGSLGERLMAQAKYIYNNAQKVQQGYTREELRRSESEWLGVLQTQMRQAGVNTLLQQALRINVSAPSEDQPYKPVARQLKSAMETIREKAPNIFDI